MVSEKRNIVWIASYPKSGNTWFRILLKSILEPERKSIDINSLDSSNVLMAGNRKIFDTITGLDSSDLLPEEILNLRPKVYKELSTQNTEDVYIKVHDAWRYVDNDLPLFPQEITKCVIIIVRNPLDLVVSFANHSGISIKDSVNLINDSDFRLEDSRFKLPTQLSQFIGDWSSHYSSWACDSGLPKYILRYEDMIMNPIVTISNVFSYLGFKVSLQRIKEINYNYSFDRLKEQETEKGFIEKPLKSKAFFNVGKCNYWRDYLDTEDVNSILDKHFSVMKELDYLDD
jgi:hypothetical protein